MARPTEHSPAQNRSRPGLARASLICVLANVREYAEGDPVELWLRDGRLVIRASNQAGLSCVDVDLWDIITWISTGPNRRVLDAYATRSPDGDNPNPDRGGA